MTPRPPTLLCLDLATLTGWSFGPAGERPRRGTWDLGRKPKTPRVVRLLCLRAFLSDFLAVNSDVDEIGFEAPMTPRIMSDIGSSIDTALLLFGCCNEAEAAAYERGLECSMHDVQDVRRHFTGHGRYKDTYDPVEGRIVKSREMAKRATMARAKLIGVPCENDNEADAVALHYYLSAQRWPASAVRSTPLFGGVAA